MRRSRSRQSRDRHAWEEQTLIKPWIFEFMQAPEPSDGKALPGTVTAVFNEAVRLERRPDNPAGSRKVKTPAVARPELDVPNADRVRAILQAAKDGPHYVDLALAADEIRRGIDRRDVEIRRCAARLRHRLLDGRCAQSLRGLLGARRLLAARERQR